MAQSIVFADEMIDSKGSITPCKIITVCDGLIEYQQNGCIYSIQRANNQPIFNDYVDVRTKLFRRHTIARHTGTVILKDFGGVKIRANGEDMQIPWWRVKFVGVYNPN